MMRTTAISLLLALAACSDASGDSQDTASAKEETCVPERVKVGIEHDQILWNDEAVDEPELARRSAAHWCGERPYVIVFDQALPAPDDRAAIARSIRVSRLIGTKQATLAETLKQLAAGTY